jgi:hypothetical protein
MMSEICMKGKIILSKVACTTEDQDVGPLLIGLRRLEEEMADIIKELGSADR